MEVCLADSVMWMSVGYREVLKRSIPLETHFSCSKNHSIPTRTTAHGASPGGVGPALIGSNAL